MLQKYKFTQSVLVMSLSMIPAGRLLHPPDHLGQHAMLLPSPLSLKEDEIDLTKIKDQLANN